MKEEQLNLDLNDDMQLAEAYYKSVENECKHNGANPTMKMFQSGNRQWYGMIGCRWHDLSGVDYIWRYRLTMPQYRHIATKYFNSKISYI